MTVLGNHDLNDVGASNWASSIEIKMFAVPRNARPPARRSGTTRSTRATRTSSCSTRTRRPSVTTQTNWLAADLAATTRKWKFAFFHHTPYSCATGFAALGSSLNVRNAVGPLFEQYGVDVVFDGHDHSYERSIAVDDSPWAAAPARTARRRLHHDRRRGKTSTAMPTSTTTARRPAASRVERAVLLARRRLPGGPTNPSHRRRSVRTAASHRFHHSTSASERQHAHRAGASTRTTSSSTSSRS
jgi:hypothetical protein